MSRCPAVRSLLALVTLLGVPVAGTAQIDRVVDRAYVRAAVEAGGASLVQSEATWRGRLRETTAVEANARELFGYNPPGLAVRLAFLRAFLYEQERRDEDARAAFELLRRMAAYRDEVPVELFRHRSEYRQGLPAVPSFFQLADYAKAWRRVRGHSSISAAERALVDEAVASSADFVFVFPEWGAHNRAMLRAESLLEAALCLPDHPRAPAWRRMAAILAEDSRGKWEVEDAMSYHLIWTWAVMRYADASGEADWWRAPMLRTYLRYFLELMTPRGTLPDFGDSWWRDGLPRAYRCFERGAAAYDDPEMKWAAVRVWEAMAPAEGAAPTVGLAWIYADLAGASDPDLVPREPAARSGVVIDDVIGKKVLFRGGWEEDDHYLLLNFRDEGDWGRLDRDFLRRTLAVQEEKMHHGHEDENSIVLWTHAGSVMLHDGGYREALPSGPYGAYRADVFHNRLVARRAEITAQEGLFEFLRDHGAYERVRSEKIDFVEFEPLCYSRTRVSDPHRGITSDRTLIHLDESGTLVVFDTVRIDEAGPRSLATLWAVQELLGSGVGWARGRTRQIRGVPTPGGHDLALLFPGAEEAAPRPVPESFALRRHAQPETVVAQVAHGDYAVGRYVSFVTVLAPVAEGTEVGALRDRVKLLPTSRGDRAQALELRTEEAIWTFVVKADLSLGTHPENVRPRDDPQAGTIGAGRCRSDADFLALRESASSRWWGATNMTHVRVGEESFMEAAPSNYFQPSGRSDVVGRSRWRRWEETRER